MTFEATFGATTPKHDPSDRKWQEELAQRAPVADGQERKGYGFSWNVYREFPTLALVYPGSPADKAGLKSNDQITAIQDKPTRGLILADADAMFKLGGAGGVKLTIARNGQTFDLTIASGTYRDCPASGEYQNFINTAANYFVDPPRMGNLTEMQHRYDCQIRNPDEAVALAAKAIDGLHDPYTKVYNKAALKSEDNSQNNELVGAGITEDKDDQGWKITSVIPESPADKAGLETDDHLISIGGRLAKEMSRDDIGDAFRNGVGKTLEVKIDRDGSSVDLHVQPAKYKMPTIDKDLGDGIAYIRSTTFSPIDAPSEMRSALERHANAKAYVIDMRRNGGGLVNNAMSMAEFFVEKGTLTTLQEREFGSSMSNPVYSNKRIEVGNWFETRTTSDGTYFGHGFTFWSRQPYLVGNKPVVILVDDGTASAAEMFTGALRDNNVATVVGEKTYGKGIGQVTLRDLPQSNGLHVTTLRYLTPSGAWLGDANQNRNGITPDFIVHNDRRTKFLSSNDNQLNKAVEILKSKIH